MLHEIGAAGQLQLLQSRVLIIGAGGLGSPAALYLAAAGVGTIGIVDSDRVDLSNLQRQILHSAKELGNLKVDSAAARISRLNSDVNVIPYNERIDNSNIAHIISDRKFQFIIDATDNFAAKFLINDACVRLQKAFSHGGILGFQGQTMTYIPGKGPCYRCVFQNPPETVPNRKNGVLGAVAGTIGTIQAAEAIKFLLGIGNNLCGCLLTYDSLGMDIRKIKVSRRENCPVCANMASNLTR